MEKLSTRAWRQRGQQMEHQSEPQSKSRRQTIFVQHSQSRQLDTWNNDEKDNDVIIHELSRQTDSLLQSESISQRQLNINENNGNNNQQHEYVLNYFGYWYSNDHMNYPCVTASAASKMRPRSNLMLFVLIGIIPFILCGIIFGEYVFKNENDCDYSLCNGYYPPPNPTPAIDPSIIDFDISSAGLREQLVLKDVFDIFYGENSICECTCNGYYYPPTIEFESINVGLCKNDIFGVVWDENDIINEINAGIGNNGVIFFFWKIFCR